jgi:hypothetical protein
MINDKKHLKTVCWIFIISIFSGITLIGQFKEPILARVGEKEITLNEFMKRSELTIRPNNLKDKYIVLNNLIFEKILALEAGEKSRLLKLQSFQLRIQGIKEQIMRDKLFETTATNKVVLDSAQLKKTFKLSIREYEVEFYRMRKQFAQEVKGVLDSVPELTDDMFKSMADMLGKQPTHKVNYKDTDDDVINDVLYTKPLKLGVALGPIELSNGEYIVMKVLNWVDYPLLSGIDQHQRWNEVQEKEKKKQAAKLWLAFQKNVMKGKSIAFNKDSFKLLSDLAMANYMNGQRKKDSVNFRIAEMPITQQSIDFSTPFFSFNSRQWTIGDFKKELLLHPLVFRTTNLDSSNFTEHFKLAVIDMMRDRCLTQDAYDRSLDKTSDVNGTVTMWKDSYIANDYQKIVIDTAKKKGTVNETDPVGILKYWESYVNDIQKKYSSLIYVNYDMLNKISLTTIDMYTWRPGIPFPALVPEFPAYIFSENLGFIKRTK